MDVVSLHARGMWSACMQQRHCVERAAAIDLHQPGKHLPTCIKPGPSLQLPTAPTMLLQRCVVTQSAAPMPMTRATLLPANLRAAPKVRPVACVLSGLRAAAQPVFSLFTVWLLVAQHADTALLAQRWPIPNPAYPQSAGLASSAAQLARVSQFELSARWPEIFPVPSATAPACTWC